MKTVRRSALLWYSPQEMYRLVTEVDHYPEFLPWCDGARVVSADEAGNLVEIGMAFSGIHHKSTTRNVYVDARQVTMTLVDGPFSQLDGEWQFIPLGDGSQRACKVELLLNYGFDSAALAALVGPVFDRIAASMVDAFVKRAEQVYG